MPRRRARGPAPAGPHHRPHPSKRGRHAIHTVRTRRLAAHLAAGAVACLATTDGVAQTTREIVLGPGHSATIHLMRDATELVPPCRPGALDFELDSLEDPEWTRSNREAWDDAALLHVLESSMKRAYAQAPGPPPVLCVGIAARPPHRVLELLRGIGAAVMSPRLIVFFLAPSLSAEWLEDLPATVTHEYHHAAYWRGARTGLDVLVREGLAHHFARTLYPSLVHPSTRALDPDEVGPAWDLIRADLDMAPREFTEVYMFGGPRNGDRVPGWAGYTIAYCLVSRYARAHPELSTADLAAVPVGEFIVDDPECRAPQRR